MARILVIDDDPDICRILTLVLVRHGYHVEVHLHGASAIASFRANPADLIITDVYMPEMDGIELILELDEVAPTVPVIVMSGGGITSMESVLTDAHHFGAISTLTKPIDVVALLAAVRSALAGPENGGSGTVVSTA